MIKVIHFKVHQGNNFEMKVRNYKNIKVKEKRAYM